MRLTNPVILVSHYHKTSITSPLEEQKTFCRLTFAEGELWNKKLLPSHTFTTNLPWETYEKRRQKIGLLTQLYAAVLLIYIYYIDYYLFSEAVGYWRFLLLILIPVQ